MTIRPIKSDISSIFAVLPLLFSQAGNAAVPIVVDDFNQPAVPTTRIAYGSLTSSTRQISFNTLSSSVRGGIRGSYFNVYNDDPLKSISAMSVGRGTLSIAQGTGAIAEAGVGYGAFTRPQPNVGGPLLKLNLSNYNGLKFDFSGVEDGLNVNVTYYTSEPLNPNLPLYYATNGVNIAPTASGKPLSFVLKFGNNPGFNWSRVDGIYVIINRAGPTPHTSYTLDKLTLVGP